MEGVKEEKEIKTELHTETKDSEETPPSQLEPGEEETQEEITTDTAAVTTSGDDTTGGGGDKGREDKGTYKYSACTCMCLLWWVFMGNILQYRKRRNISMGLNFIL